MPSGTSDFELVIHDNSSEAGGFETAGPGCDDPRVRYVFDSSPMSIGENFERSVALANGNFVSHDRRRRRGERQRS